MENIAMRMATNGVPGRRPLTVLIPAQAKRGPRSLMQPKVMSTMG